MGRPALAFYVNPREGLLEIQQSAYGRDLAAVAASYGSAMEVTLRDGQVLIIRAMPLWGGGQPWIVVVTFELAGEGVADGK